MSLKLNLGCWTAWRDGCLNIDRRLDPTWPDREGMFVKDRMEKLDELFHCESVREIWANDVFVGVSLGTVTKMLMSWHKILVPKGKLHLLTDAHVPQDFLIEVLKDLGYDIDEIRSTIRWTTIEAVKRGLSEFAHSKGHN